MSDDRRPHFPGANTESRLGSGGGREVCATLAIPDPVVDGSDEEELKMQIQEFDLKTAAETTDGHRFTQIEKEMGDSTGLEPFHLLGDP